MAKKKTADKKIGGPFVAAAFFCENILEDMRKMLSIQGVTDTLNLTLGPHAPPDVPSKENPLAINQQLLLVFRSGDSPGKHRLKLVIEGPDGKRKKFKEDDVTFSDPPQGGINVKVAVTLVLDSGGLFWIDVVSRPQADDTGSDQHRHRQSGGANRGGAKEKGLVGHR